MKSKSPCYGEVEARRRMAALAREHAEDGTVALAYRTRLAMAIRRL